MSYVLDNPMPLSTLIFGLNSQPVTSFYGELLHSMPPRVGFKDGLKSDSWICVFVGTLAQEPLQRRPKFH